MWVLSIVLIVVSVIIVKYRNNAPKEFKQLLAARDLAAAFGLLTATDMVTILERCYAPSLYQDGIARTYIGGASGVMISNPEYFKEVLSKTGTFPKLAVSDSHYSLLNKLVGENIVFANGKDWKLRRELINPLFRMGWEPASFGSVILDFFETIEKVDSSPDLYHAMELITLDTLGNILFGFDFQAIRNPKGEHVVSYSAAAIAAYDMLYISIPILDRFPFGSRSQGHHAVKHFRQMLSNLALKKSEEIQNASTEREKGPRDLLTVYAQAWLDKRMEFESIIDDIITMIIAGHDTTANALACTIYLLAKHSEAQDKVREEISRVFESHTSTKEIPSTKEIKCRVRFLCC
ncbi:cytochrome P450-dit2, variant 2 [Basidiobolus ranarum]|uniref:Cytochrome P450-dit2, variant 2 n=1 Tax=Basidiobolus ranarum TaxID=34480 RepID=A0ABR2VP35_9FUNG